MMRPFYLVFAAGMALLAAGCSAASERGIADKRSDFSKFIPMTTDPAKDGLKEVKPYFASADKRRILAAIERACTGSKAGSAVTNERTGAGYYVNCNPRNRQLLNGYAPTNPKEKPHSR